MNKCRRRKAKARRRKARWIIVRMVRLRKPKHSLRRRRISVSELGWLRRGLGPG